MTTRFEKVLWIAADPRVSYGEVVTVLSDLRQDTPDARLVIATSQQTGPVDPETNDFAMIRLEHMFDFYKLCPGRP